MLDRLPIPTLPAVVGLPLLIVAGVVLLLFGWRLYRVVLVMIVVLAGGCLAAALVQRWGVLAMLATGLPAGFLSGLLSVAFERYGVFVLGCVAGAAPVLASSVYFYSDHTVCFAALAAGLILGALAVLFWKPAIILSLSVLGATFLERGVILSAERLRAGLGDQIITAYNVPLCLVYFGFILIGVLAQYREPKPAPQGEPRAPDTATV